MGTVHDSQQRIVRNTAYPTVAFADSFIVHEYPTQAYNANKPGWITLKADADNTVIITVGTYLVASDDGYVLEADQEVTIEHNKLSDIYCIIPTPPKLPPGWGDPDPIIHIIGSYQDN